MHERGSEEETKAMSELKEVIDHLRLVGEEDSEGRFTIDSERAEKILAETQVADKAIRGLDKEKVAALRKTIRGKIANSETSADLKGKRRAARVFRSLEKKIRKATKNGEQYVMQRLWPWQNNHAVRKALSGMLQEVGLVMQTYVYARTDAYHGSYKWKDGFHDWSSKKVRIDLLSSGEG